MEVLVCNIGESPVSVEDQISPKNWDLDSDEVKFVDSIYINAEFRKVGREILVDAHVDTKKEIECCRCLEVVIKEESNDFLFSYNVDDLGETLDIVNDVKEEILLNWPMKALCSENCKGLDPNTGEKIN